MEGRAPWVGARGVVDAIEAGTGCWIGVEAWSSASGISKGCRGRSGESVELGLDVDRGRKGAREGRSLLLHCAQMDR